MLQLQVSIDQFERRNLNGKNVCNRPKDTTRLYSNLTIFTHIGQKSVNEILGALHWDILADPLYSPDVAPPDYHLFRSIQSANSLEQFSSFTKIENWLDVSVSSKQPYVFHCKIRLLPERWTNVVASDRISI